MRKVLKWIGIVLAALIGLLLIAVIALNISGRSKLGKTNDVQAEAITISDDEAVLARGQHLVELICTDCHGSDLSGGPMIEDPSIGAIHAPNITGLSETYGDADYVRAIRHAVGPDDRQLIIMPAEVFINFSQEDLGAVIAYLKTLPHTGQDTPEPQLTFMGHTLLGAGIFGDIFPAEYIDHDQPFPAMPPVGANVEYGAYLASSFCTFCHGPELTGGTPPDPDSIPAPNLAPNGRLGSWSEADFLTVMRTGQTPDGRQLDSEYMPWSIFAKFEEQELQALWLYLQTLDPAGG